MANSVMVPPMWLSQCMVMHACPIHPCAAALECISHCLWHQSALAIHFVHAMNWLFVALVVPLPLDYKFGLINHQIDVPLSLDIRCQWTFQSALWRGMLYICTCWPSLCNICLMGMMFIVRDHIVSVVKHTHTCQPCQSCQSCQSCLCVYVWLARERVCVCVGGGVVCLCVCVVNVSNQCLHSDVHPFHFVCIVCLLLLSHNVYHVLIR